MIPKKTAKKRIREKVFAAASAYLDPLSCDSTVSYKVVKSRRLYGAVHITDCNRKIELYFYDKTPLAKIDTMIDALQKFRAALAAARQSRPRARGRNA